MLNTSFEALAVIFGAENDNYFGFPVVVSVPKNVHERVDLCPRAQARPALKILPHIILLRNPRYSTPWP